MIVSFVKSVFHNGRMWSIMKINGSYFARQNASDTGPYSTAEQAEDFIKAIQP